MSYKRRRASGEFEMKSADDDQLYRPGELTDVDEYRFKLAQHLITPDDITEDMLLSSR